MHMSDRFWLITVRAIGLARRHAGIITVLAVALAARLIYLSWFKVFPPGDVFNFIAIARGLPEGTYSPDERRLPFYPLLILFARSLLDWEAASLTVAVVASLAALVALYALGRTLGLSKTALAALLLVLQVHPQVLTATRGYADTTLFALLPLSLLALFRTRTWKGAVITGVLYGALALTRYEGLAAALVLLPLWFLLPREAPSERSGISPAGSTPALGDGASAGFDRRSHHLARRYGYPRRHAVIGALTFVVCLLPYLLLSAANDRPAFGAGYIAEVGGREGYGSGNAREFWESELAIWKRTGLFGAWEIPLAIAREIGEDPLATPRILTARLVEPGEPLAFLALLGVLVLLRRRQWRTLLFLLAAAAAASIPPAWFNPLRRYDIVVLPFTILFAATGLSAIQRLLERGTRNVGWSGTAVRWIAGAMLMTVAAGLWTVTNAEDVRNRQRKHNGRDYAYYQAIQAARRLPGRIAFAQQQIITEFHFGARARYLEHLGTSGTVPAVLPAALRAESVSYVVLKGSPDSALVSATVAPAKLVADFSWPRLTGEVTRAVIYRLDP